MGDPTVKILRGANETKLLTSWHHRPFSWAPRQCPSVMVDGMERCRACELSLDELLDCFLSLSSYNGDGKGSLGIRLVIPSHHSYSFDCHRALIMCIWLFFPLLHVAYVRTILLPLYLLHCLTETTKKSFPSLPSLALISRRVNQQQEERNQKVGDWSWAKNMKATLIRGKADNNAYHFYIYPTGVRWKKNSRQRRNT